MSGPPAGPTDSRASCRVLRIDDGRTLEVSDTGPALERVLLFLHGTPGCAHQPRYLAAATEARGLRLVTFSRPGYASSTRLAGRAVADVADDAAALVESIGAGRALVAGVSGGGPHALACAALRPDRFSAAIVISGIAPFDASDLDFLAGMGQDNLDEYAAALGGEAQLRTLLENEADTMRSGTLQGVLDVMGASLPDSDRAVLTAEEGRDFLEGAQHALSGTIDGWVDDDLAFINPWGFDPTAIEVPTSLWHGTADVLVPVAHGEWLAERIPGVHSHIEPDEGHLSLRLHHIGAMLDEALRLSGAP